MSLELGLSIVSLFLTSTFSIIAVLAFIDIKALKSSTHKIEYVPFGSNEINYVDDNAKDQSELVKGMVKMHNLEDEFGDL